MSKTQTETHSQFVERFTIFSETFQEVFQLDSLATLKLVLEYQNQALLHNDTFRVALMSKQAGQCNLYLGRYTEALKCTYFALEYFKTIEDYPVIIACQIELGLGYAGLGDFPDGMEWFELALENSKKYNRPRGIYTSLANIRDVELKLGNYEQALYYGENSLKIAKEINDNNLKTNEEASLGITYIKLAQKEMTKNLTNAVQRFKDGIELLRKARETAKNGVLPGLEIEIFNVEAIALAELGQIKEAFILNDLAIETASHDNNPGTTADSEKTRGWLYNKINQPLESVLCYEKSLIIYEKQSRKNEVANTHRELTEVRKTLGQYQQALEHLEQYYVIDSQLRIDATERRAQALAVKLDLEKVRYDAEMHRVRSEELAALNLKLQEQAVLLEKLAREDELTGLANRRRLEEFATQAFGHARETNTGLCMAMADLDFFKKVNDQYGHATGDDVMRVLGGLLRKHCPENGLAARYGGEEFVLILPDATAAQTHDLCEKIRLELQNYDWKQLHPALAVTICFGFSDSQEASSHERLLSNADIHLYAAKNAGRNCTRPDLT